jgi:hypothetical protein
MDRKAGGTEEGKNGEQRLIWTPNGFTYYIK